MDNYNLFEKILFRVSKEYGIQNIIFKCYNREKIFKYISKHIRKGEDIYLDFFILKECINCELETYTHVLSKHEFCRTFNDIIYDLAQKYFFEFLNKNKITTIFINNLFDNSIQLSWANKCDSIEKYITNLKKNSISPFNIMKDGFIWSLTKHGYDFWRIKHRQFKIFLIKKLFNINLKLDGNINYTSS